MLSATTLAANLILAVGAWVQGSVGFGMALFAAPLLLVIAPDTVPGPLLAAMFLLLVLTFLRERRAADHRGIGWALAGRVPGSVVGALTLASLDPRALGLTLGVLTLLAVLLTTTRLPIERRPPWLFGAGAVSGFMGTTAAIGGPAVALLYQHEQGPTVRASLAAYFVVGALISLSLLAWVGRLTLEDLLQAATMTPGVVVGFLLSKRTGAYLDRGRTRLALLTVAGLSGVAAIARALLQ